MARNPKKNNSSRRSNAVSSQPAKSTHRKPTPSQNIRRKLRQLSLQHRLEILGVILILIGLFSFISLFTGPQSGFFASFALSLKQIAGIGSFLLPIAFLAFGLWLVFRKEIHLPFITAQRLTGIVLLITNLFTWAHWIAGGGWDLAQNGGGGGYLGAVFERILVITLGDMGGFVILFAWTLIALTLTLDISIPDLFRNLTHTAVKTKDVVTDGTGQLVSRVGDVKGKKVGKVSQQSTPMDESEFTPISKKGSGRMGLKITPIKIPSSRPVNQGNSSSQASSTLSTKPTLVIHRKSPAAKYQLPKIADILNSPRLYEAQTAMDAERSAIIEETLAALGAPSRVVAIQHGPTFTQFCVEPGYIETNKNRTRVKVSQINSFWGDLALALSARSVRIEAPVPGKPYIGIEVPNQQLEVVALREGMESKAFQKAKGALTFVLGKDVSGNPISVSLGEMPHLLIAGSTNSGKSVCINSIITCLLLQYTPDELRMILVDPKRVEFTNYNGIPHLLTPVVVNPEKVTQYLQWLLREMDSRYYKFQQMKVRNIEEFNTTQPVKLPYIVVAIDELADLMMLSPTDTEITLNRLAQMARATGIHLIIATQRPSVDIITGKIKANFPARISFSVVSGTDSRVVIDKNGADRLIGRGDMLFTSPDTGEPKRLQGAYVSDEEIVRLVNYWQQAAEAMKKSLPEASASNPMTIPLSALQPQIPLIDQGVSMGEDQLIDKAVTIIRIEERASISLLQRKLGIGYMRAARMIEKLEEMGVIGKPEPGSGVRPVLDFGGEKGDQDDIH